MSHDIAITQTVEEASIALYLSLADEVEELDDWARSEATRRGYCSDFAGFVEWARGHGVDLPECDDTGHVRLSEPVSVPLLKAYLADRQDQLKWRTLARHLSAIRWVHHENALPSATDHPAVRKTMAALKRRHQYRTHQAGPLRLYDLQPMLPGRDGLKATRDRALLTFGFWSAMRRSELVRVTVEDLEYADAGIVVRVPFSKTDQTGAGANVPINHQHSTECDKVAKCQGHAPCPVCELRGWLKTAGIKTGPVWRAVDRHGNLRDGALSPASVSEILKGAVQAGGGNPATYSAHSLRSGFVSTMDEHGVPRAAIRAVTRHKAEASMDGYARPDVLLRDGAGAYLAETPTQRRDHEARRLADRY